MAIILKMLGRDVSDLDLSKLVGTDGSTTFAQLVEFANTHGLKAEAVVMGPESIGNLKGPAILHLKVPHHGDRVTEHFVVFAGLDSARRAVVLDATDPMLTSMEPDILFRSWTGNALIFESPRPHASTSFAGAAWWLVPGLALIATAVVARFLTRRKYGPRTA